MTLYILSSLAGTVLLGLAVYLAFRVMGTEPEGRIDSVSRSWLNLSDSERQEMQERVVERMRGAA